MTCACEVSHCFSFTAGNNHLGGQDFNERLLQHMLKHVALQHQQVLSDPEDLQALRLATEQIKLQLSTQTQAEVGSFDETPPPQFLCLQNTSVLLPCLLV